MSNKYDHEKEDLVAACGGDIRGDMADTLSDKLLKIIELMINGKIVRSESVEQVESIFNEAELSNKELAYIFSVISLSVFESAMKGGSVKNLMGMLGQALAKTGLKKPEDCDGDCENCNSPLGIELPGIGDFGRGSGQSGNCGNA